MYRVLFPQSANSFDLYQSQTLSLRRTGSRTQTLVRITIRRRRNNGTIADPTRTEVFPMRVRSAFDRNAEINEVV